MLLLNQKCIWALCFGEKELDIPLLALTIKLWPLFKLLLELIRVKSLVDTLYL